MGGDWYIIQRFPFKDKVAAAVVASPTGISAKCFIQRSYATTAAVMPSCRIRVRQAKLQRKRGERARVLAGRENSTYLPPIAIAKVAERKTKVHPISLQA